MSTNTSGKPTQFLVSKIDSGTSVPVGFYNDPSSSWDGMPSVFQVNLTVETQFHSDDTTSTPFQYNSSDIDAGDWILLPSGKTYKIVNVISTNTTTEAVVEIEDVDIYVLKGDVTGGGDNYPDEEQYGIIFELDSEGQPILAGINQLSAQFPNITYWIQDAISRFNFDYVDEEGIETPMDLNQTPDITEEDGDPTGVFISYTPFQDSNVQILVNGINVNLGDGIKTMACYFSADNGATARAIADITAGDQLHWNGSIAGYELDATDDVDIIYEASSLDV